jgi:HEAT repeat protein
MTALGDIGDESAVPSLLSAFEKAVGMYRPAVPGTYDFPEREREYGVLKALAQMLIRVGDPSALPGLIDLKHKRRNADGYLREIVDEVIKALDARQNRTR